VTQPFLSFLSDVALVGASEVFDMRVGLDSYTYIKQLSSKQWDLWDLLRHAVRLRLDELQIMHDLLEKLAS